MEKSGTAFVPTGTKKPSADDVADEAIVRQLPDKPTFDKEREFPGITKQKMTRKDKHMAALDDYAKLLDKVSETLEQELLTSSRVMREKLEEADAQRELKHKQYHDDNFLIVRSEAELIEELGSMKALLARRSQIIEDFAAELDGLEGKRADILTKEMKKLVDLLISIGTFSVSPCAFLFISDREILSQHINFATKSSTSSKTKQATSTRSSSSTASPTPTCCASYVASIPSWKSNPSKFGKMPACTGVKFDKTKRCAIIATKSTAPPTPTPLTGELTYNK